MAMRLRLDLTQMTLEMDSSVECKFSGISSLFVCFMCLMIFSAWSTFPCVNRILGDSGVNLSEKEATIYWSLIV